MIAVACDEDGVVALDVAEGQRNDAPLARGVLVEARDAVGVVRDVLGDKGFDSDAVRDVVLDDLDALPVIPNRKNRKEPWPWDDAMREAYKQRNRVERAFGVRSANPSFTDGASGCCSRSAQRQRADPWRRWDSQVPFSSGQRQPDAR